MTLFADEIQRRALFPVCREKVFLAHAGVTALPQPVADAMIAYTREASQRPQEFEDVLREMKETRRDCANLIGARPEEIALLGPTSLGLSLIANGLDWKEGDEVLCYRDDYPANVYPWLDLRRRGVNVRYLEPDWIGEITPELVERSLTPHTKLVALASAHFFSGYRIDVNAIGRMLRERGVLFCVDAIQTLGAFPFSVEHVDFLSADAHKWLLGPCAIGIVYVRREHFDRLRPTLLGAWNIYSPQFQAQEEIKFMPSAQRYEPGVLNLTGVYGLRAAVVLLANYGLDRIEHRILQLKTHLLTQLDSLGFEVTSPRAGAAAHGITTFRHPRVSATPLYQALENAGVICSLRHDRQGRDYLRFSPHFYNTEAELDVAIEILQRHL